MMAGGRGGVQLRWILLHDKFLSLGPYPSSDTETFAPICHSIVIFLSSSEMMHNFEKYTVGQVEALPANKNFYDYDVSILCMLV